MKSNMSLRTLSRSANNIINMLSDLSLEYSLDVDFVDVGFSNQCYKKANELGLYTLLDIFNLSKEKIKELYNYDSDKLATLERNIRRIYGNPSSYLSFENILDENDEEEEATCFDDILNGWETVEEYNEEHLEEMADWEDSRGYESKMTIDINGFIYECDSDIELKLINRLLEDNYFKELRGQNLEIEYRMKRKGKNNKYKPDLVLLNQDNYIVIVEAKPLYNMPTNKNLKKYNALSRYCKDNGYLYCMCDEKYRTINDLNTFEIDEDVADSIGIYLDIYGVFDKFGYDSICEEFEYYAKSYLKEMIAAIVVQHNLYFSKGDLSGGINNLKIFRKKSSTI